MNQLTTPAELREREAATATVEAGRREIENILDGTDQRLLVVVGPCSIHDVDLAKEYAKRLLPLRKALSATMNIVMRVYFEKPRTTVGWKGFINDPDLDDSFYCCGLPKPVCLQAPKHLTRSVHSTCLICSAGLR